MTTESQARNVHHALKLAILALENAPVSEAVETALHAVYAADAHADALLAAIDAPTTLGAILGVYDGPAAAKAA